MKPLALIPLVILFGCGGKKENNGAYGFTVTGSALRFDTLQPVHVLSNIHDTIRIHDTIYLDSYLQENKSHIK